MPELQKSGRKERAEAAIARRSSLGAEQIMASRAGAAAVKARGIVNNLALAGGR
jgi:hypothetical protein